MAIAVIFPVSPTNVGPGYSVEFTNSIGLPGDKMNVQLVDTATGFEHTYAVLPISAPGAAQVALGVDGLNPSIEINSGMRGTLAVGAAMTLNFLQVGTPFVIRDSASFPGYLWDPTGGLYVMMQRLQLQGGGGAMLTSIYNAVHKLFP